MNYPYLGSVIYNFDHDSEDDYDYDDWDYVCDYED